MMEDESADAGLRVHHHAFGEVDADFLWAQEEPDAGLVFEIRAGGITKAVALATKTVLEAVGHRERRWIREAPVFANPPVLPLGACFCCFNRERLKAVREKIAARRFCGFGPLANTSACADNEKRDVIAGAVGSRQRVVAKAQIAGGTLALEVESG